MAGSSCLGRGGKESMLLVNPLFFSFFFGLRGGIIFLIKKEHAAIYDLKKRACSLSILLFFFFWGFRVGITVLYPPHNRLC